MGFNILISVCILTICELFVLNLPDADILIYLNHVLKLFSHGSMGITCRYAASHCQTSLLIQRFFCWKKKKLPQILTQVTSDKKMNKIFLPNENCCPTSTCAAAEPHFKKRPTFGEEKDLIWDPPSLHGSVGPFSRTPLRLE